VLLEPRGLAQIPKIFISYPPLSNCIMFFDNFSLLGVCVLT
jgi:hypothetical protein